MPKKKRPLNRKEGAFRDCALIVIASEDRFAVEQYFKKFQPRRIQFLILPTEDGRSSPDHLFERIATWKAENNFIEGDQFWLVLDTDHWIEGNHRQNLITILNERNQRNFRTAISNPCFELWLLLHFQDCPEGDSFTCDEVVTILKEAAGAYSKTKVYNLKIETDQVTAAMDRAKSHDRSNDWIPDVPSSQVYKVLDELVARESIVLKEKEAES